MTNLEREIFGQMVDAITGDPIGGNFLISSVGAPGELRSMARDPSVAYSPTDNRFLVVFSSVIATSDPNNEIVSIRGQFVKGTGQLDGVPFRVHEPGFDRIDDINFLIDFAPRQKPAVAFNAANGPDGEGGRYCVAWTHGDFADQQTRMRLFAPSGAPIGPSMVASGSLAKGKTAAIVSDPRDGRFLILFPGKLSNASGIVDSIYSQRITDAGIPEYNLPRRVNRSDYHCAVPALAYCEATGSFLATWVADTEVDATLLTDFELFSQVVDNSGEPQLLADTKLTEISDPGFLNLVVSAPVVAYDETMSMAVIVFGALTGSGAKELFALTLDPSTGIPQGEAERLTENGGATETNYYIDRPAMAFSTVGGEIRLFSVWQSFETQDFGLLAPQVVNIFGRQFRAATGGGASREPTTAKTLLSTWEIDTGGTFADSWSDVAYSPDLDIYFVVWHSDTFTGEFQIYGQTIDATGREIFEDDVLVSGDANESSRYQHPSVVWNPANGSFVVTHEGQTTTFGAFENEIEIYASVIHPGEEGNVRARLSKMGPTGDERYEGRRPDITYNADREELFVVWQGDHDAQFTGNDDFGIYARRLDGTGDVSPIDEMFRVDSLTGLAGDAHNTDYSAFEPAVAYHPTEKEYVVVYHGKDTVDGDDVKGVFATRLSGIGRPLNPFTSYLLHKSPHPQTPDIAAATDTDGYLAVWGYRGRVEGVHLNAAIGQPGESFIIAREPSNFNPAVVFDPAVRAYVITWDQSPSVGAASEKILRDLASFGAAGPGECALTPTALT